MYTKWRWCFWVSGALGCPHLILKKLKPTYVVNVKYFIFNLLEPRWSLWMYEVQERKICTKFKFVLSTYLRKSILHLLGKTSTIKAWEGLQITSRMPLKITIYHCIPWCLCISYHHSMYMVMYFLPLLRKLIFFWK